MSTRKIIYDSGEQVSYAEMKRRHPGVTFPPFDIISDERIDSALGIVIRTEEVPEHVASLDELKAVKLAALEQSFDERVSGSFVCSMGWPMQFDRSDCVAVQGAVTLLEARGLSAGYLTDAVNVTHEGVPLASIRAVLIEMLAVYADAHSKKQGFRAAVSACTSQGELDGITFDWESE